MEPSGAWRYRARPALDLRAPLGLDRIRILAGAGPGVDGARDGNDRYGPAAVVARLYFIEANYRMWLTQFRASLDAAERALAHLGPSADVRDVAEGKFRAGYALSLLGSASEGRSLLLDALAAYRQLQLPKMTCMTLFCLATAGTLLNDTASARTFCTEAIVIARAHRFSVVANAALGTLAELEFRAGDTQAALRLAADALAEARTMESAFQQTAHSCNMAAYSLVLGNFADARAYDPRHLAQAGRSAPTS